jgi:hypothetical protein
MGGALRDLVIAPAGYSRLARTETAVPRNAETKPWQPSPRDAFEGDGSLADGRSLLAVVRVSLERDRLFRSIVTTRFSSS